jgi:hypothetical protein
MLERMSCKVECFICYKRNFNRPSHWSSGISSSLSKSIMIVVVMGCLLGRVISTLPSDKEPSQLGPDVLHLFPIPALITSLLALSSSTLFACLASSGCSGRLITGITGLGLGSANGGGFRDPGVITGLYRSRYSDDCGGVERITHWGWDISCEDSGLTALATDSGRGYGDCLGCPGCLECSRGV